MGMNSLTAPTPRTVELYSLVLTTRILKLRGIGAREVNRLIASGTLQRIQRGAYIYGFEYDASPPTRPACKGSSRTNQPRCSGGST